MEETKGFLMEAGGYGVGLSGYALLRKQEMKNRGRDQIRKAYVRP